MVLSINRSLCSSYLVEAGGVELQVGVENTQLADSAISLTAPFARFARSVSRFVTISPKMIPTKRLVTCG
jgi:hypothetical protein